MGPINDCLPAVRAHSLLPMIIILPSAARADLIQAVHAYPVQLILTSKGFDAFFFHLAAHLRRAVAAHLRVRAIVIHITVIFLTAVPFRTLTITFVHKISSFIYLPAPHRPLDSIYYMKEDVKMLCIPHSEDRFTQITLVSGTSADGTVGLEPTEP
jgi:hypothetical protein